MEWEKFFDNPKGVAKVLSPAQAQELFKNRTFSFSALGGYNEVGRNCFLVEYLPTGKLIVLDAGAFFSNDFDTITPAYARDLFTSEVRESDFLPDFSYIKDRAEMIEAIFISHAHYDHLLGLIKLWQMCLRRGGRPKIITSRFAYHVILRLFGEAKVEAPIDDDFIFLTQNIRKITIDPFTLYPCQMVHSTPQSYGTGVAMEGRGLFFTCDFKWLSCKGDRVITTAKMKKRLSEVAQTVDIQMIACEALYADRNGLTPPEDTIWQTFIQILEDHPDEHIFATCFASNLERVASCARLAEKFKIKADYAGRSMLHNVAAGRQVGAYLPKNKPEECRLHLITGPQGEPGSITQRLANGQAQQLGFESTDVLVVMTEVIPGNEEQLCEMLFNAHYFFRKIYVTPAVWETLEKYVEEKYVKEEYVKNGIGVSDPEWAKEWAKILFEGDLDKGGDSFWQPGLYNRVQPIPKIHVSGHGSREDIKNLLRCLLAFQKQKPEIIPYHMPYAKWDAWEELLASL